MLVMIMIKKKIYMRRYRVVLSSWNIKGHEHSGSIKGGECLDQINDN